MSGVTDENVSGLVSLGISIVGEVISSMRRRHADANPGLPVPTDAELKAALLKAVQDTVDKDELWESTHPKIDPIEP